MSGMKDRPTKTKFLMTPEQIRARAAQQCASADPKTQQLGRLGYALATAIEKRQQNEMPDLKTLQTKLADARQKVRNLVVIGMRPDLTPEKRELVHNLERSARAEVKLRIKALEYAKTKRD
ncbi:MAG TPA: hypothetical protein VIJ78_10275 [Pseudolabrys sp.]